jgi:hypothetical protein
LQRGRGEEGRAGQRATRQRTHAHRARLPQRKLPARRARGAAVRCTAAWPAALPAARRAARRGEADMVCFPSWGEAQSISRHQPGTRRRLPPAAARSARLLRARAGGHASHSGARSRRRTTTPARGSLGRPGKSKNHAPSHRRAAGAELQRRGPRDRGLEGDLSGRHGVRCTKRGKGGGG